MMLKLAHSAGRVAIEMMWSALVALGSQLVEYLILRDAYADVCYTHLRGFIRKYVTDILPQSKGDDLLHIIKKNE